LEGFFETDFFLPFCISKCALIIYQISAQPIILIKLVKAKNYSLTPVRNFVTISWFLWSI